MSFGENNLSNLPNLPNQEKFNIMSMRNRCVRCNHHVRNCRCYRKKNCICCMIIKCIFTTFLIYLILKLIQSKEYDNFLI